jgi:hypothetical protein
MIKCGRPKATLTLNDDGEMSCLTCHDPHRDDEEPVGFYKSRCLSCHLQQNGSQTHCRVNPTTDCLNCHMPKIPSAVLHSSLTDHYIRVRKKK